MSALWAETSAGYQGDDRSFDRPARSDIRPRPRLIQGGAGTARLGGVPFVLALIVILGVGMAGLLALNTSLQGQAFEAKSLHQKANQLTYQEASLKTQVSELRASDNLAARAFKLGMRPDPNVGFIELPSGRTIGKAETVTGHEMPMFIKTPDQIKAQRKAERAKKQAEEAKREAAAARREADRQAQGKLDPKQQQKQQQDQQHRGGQG